MQGALIDWGARCGAYLRDTSPPPRWAPDVGRRRPESFLAGETLAAPADHLDDIDVGDFDLGALGDAPSERERLITELADLIGDDPVALVDALADLDAATPAQRGDSPAARVEGRRAALEAGFRSRGLEPDPDLIDQLAKDAVRHSSGWRNSSPAADSIALTER